MKGCKFLKISRVFVFCVIMLSGCGGLWDNKVIHPSTEIQETNMDESEYFTITEEEDKIIDDITSETSQVIYDKDGVMEIYANGDKISLPEDIMTAQISPQDILKGNPIIYDRVQMDGYIFEWIISDYYDDTNLFLEDAVLAVSDETDTEEVQIIHVKAEGGGAVWVLAENKFKYTDVNFDNLPDLLICTGHHGNQGLLTYYCFLQTENGFTESLSFTDIANPAVDAENKLILSQWRNSAASHSWAEYECLDNRFVLSRELREEAVVEADKEIWVWTENDREIGRSDELSEKEIEDLLYNENSEWKISSDRWRTL